MKDYKKILEGVVNIINTTEKSDIGFANICTYIGENCPELKESEDERISKLLIEAVTQVLQDQYCSNRGVSKEKVLAWLEKQGTERKQLYVRFGDIPPNEKSKIYRGEEEIGDENGVSVYPAFELNGNIVLGLTLPITRTTLYTQQHLLEYDNRPCYLVSGDYAGKGTDGEPLIRNISIIKRLDNYRIKESENQGEQKSAFEMKTPEESLGIDSDTYSKIVDECVYGEQKPAWSEEDKEIIDYLIDYLESELDSSYTDLDKETFTEEINWLKSLRPQNRWKPSDEQIEYLAKAITTLGDEGNCKTASILNDLRVELKKLKGE